jgi:alpha-glucoside transport system permease protein
MPDTTGPQVVPLPGGGGTIVPETPAGGGAVKRAHGIAVFFLLPAVFLLGALVIYPIIYSVIRSLYDASGGKFVGVDNYQTMFTSDATLTAIKNNAIWIAVAPTVVTAVGLVFAVLTERIRWATAFKFLIFMPMAISMLAAGIIFRLVYQLDPDQGLANAALRAVHDTFAPASTYPGARPRDAATLQPAGRGFATSKTFRPGETILMPLVAIRPGEVPGDAQPAASPTALSGSLTGTVWVDFTTGGGGTPGQIDKAEKGLPGVKVQAVRDGRVVATDTTGKNGTFAFDGVSPGAYTLRLPGSNFSEPFGGVNWLGPTVITWAIISAYVWIWAGFAMVVIAAGLAAIPRDTLEAARVDGGTEWQVFRKVTVPLLAPVLLVVFVTLVINVLKIFDLVIVIPPGSSLDDANVLAVEMWTVSFGGGRNPGLGSALAIFLFVLVLPAMLFNLRRFRRDAS